MQTHTFYATRHDINENLGRAPTKASLLWKDGNSYLTHKERHHMLLHGGTCSGLKHFSIIRREIK